MAAIKISILGFAIGIFLIIALAYKPREKGADGDAADTGHKRAETAAE